MNIPATIVLLALFGLGLAAMLILFLGLRRDLRKRLRKQQARIDEIDARTQAPAPVGPPMEAPQPNDDRVPGSAVNINKRIRAARLLREGGDATTIAALLGVPRREAELLVRVHQITSRGDDEATMALSTGEGISVAS